MTSPSDILLYWGDGSPPCMSVLITLEEKLLQGYQHKQLSFDRQEYKNEEVVALNPRAELPTCKIGDLVLNESIAICKYLQDKNATKGTNLEPADHQLRGLMWQRLCEFLWNCPRRCYKNYVQYLWATPAPERDMDRVALLRQDCIKELKLWEKYLGENENGDYLVGNQFTLADVAVFPWLAFFVAMGFKMETKFPKLHHYCNKMMERPSIKATFPKYWDGSVDTTVLNDLHEYA